MRTQRGKWGRSLTSREADTRERIEREHRVEWENKQRRGTPKITQSLSGEWRGSAPPGLVTGNTRRTVFRGSDFANLVCHIVDIYW